MRFGMRPLQVTLVRFLDLFHSQEKSGKVERSSLILDLDETALYGNGACLHLPRVVITATVFFSSFSSLAVREPVAVLVFRRRQRPPNLDAVDGKASGGDPSTVPPPSQPICQR